MANEWIPVELYGANGDGQKVRYTIADGASVSVGALLQLMDPRTVSASILGMARVAGVAAEEHIANKGITTIACWTNGIFQVVQSGALTALAGDFLGAAGSDNTVIAVSGATITSASMARVAGRYLQDTIASATTEVRLNL